MKSAPRITTKLATAAMTGLVAGAGACLRGLRRSSSFAGHDRRRGCHGRTRPRRMTARDRITAKARAAAPSVTWAAKARTPAKARVAAGSFNLPFDSRLAAQRLLLSNVAPCKMAARWDFSKSRPW